MKYLIILLFSLNIFANDDLKLALMLIDTNNVAKANKILEKAPKDHELYLLAKAKISLKVNNHKDTQVYLNKLIKQSDKVEYIYLLAQSLFTTKDYQRCLDILNSVKDVEHKFNYYVLLSSTYLQLNRPVKALKVVKGQLNSESSVILVKQYILVLNKLKLYRDSIDIITKYSSKFSNKDKMAFIYEFSKLTLGEFDHLVAILLNTGKPSEELIRFAAIKLYEQNKIYSAYTLLKSYELKTDKSISLLVEIAAKAGRNYEAKTLISKIRKTSEKLKLKVRLAIAQEDYDYVSGLNNSFKAHKLEDAELNYAMAYSLFYTGKYAESLDVVSKIVDPKFLGLSLALRKSINDCIEDELQCVL